MNIILLILTSIQTLCAITSVVLMITFWKYSYKEWKLLRFNFTKEGDFIRFNNEIIKALEQNPHLKNPYNPEEQPVQWSLFNMIKNINKDE